MKICIIGDFAINLDEGLKNIANHLADNLSKYSNIQLMKTNVKNIISLSTARKIKNFHPDIIHYVPGPTNRSILLLKLITKHLGDNPKLVLSAPHPLFEDITIKLLHFKPDYIFAPSKAFKERMDALGIPSHILSNGVDLQKFVPISSNTDKMNLREKYGLDKSSFTILHVGHIMNNRNLNIFRNLAKKNQTLIVASGYIKTDLNMFVQLQNKGVKIFKAYYPNIEEFYQLSDCYIFPVKPGKSILNPLSVMEAMSCDLPVITIEFEGLKTFFEAGGGLTFVQQDAEILDAVKNIKETNILPKTRAKVEPYSWANVAREIVRTYQRLMN